MIEMLSGAPFDVKFISFEDIKNDPKLLETVDVIINVGDADTAHTGGIWWEDPEISSAIRRFVWNGGGFIVSAWPSKKQETIKHPFLDEKIEWGMAPYVQSMLLARYLRGDLDEYPPFFWK